MGAGGIISAVVSILHNNTALPTVGMMAACALGGLVILHAGNAAVRHRALKTDVEDEVSVLL